MAEKRIKRKGGRMSYQQVMFFTTPEAFKQFEDNVLNIIRRDPREGPKHCARLSFKIEWEPRDVAYALNEQAIAKDKDKYPRIKPFANPLRAVGREKGDEGQ